MNFYRLIISQHVIIVIESQYVTSKYVCALSFYAPRILFQFLFQTWFMSHGARSPAILFYLSLFLFGPSQFSVVRSFSALSHSISRSIRYSPSQFTTSILFRLSTPFPALPSLIVLWTFYLPQRILKFLHVRMPPFE